MIKSLLFFSCTSLLLSSCNSSSDADSTKDSTVYDIPDSLQKVQIEDEFSDSGKNFRICTELLPKPPDSITALYQVDSVIVPSKNDTVLKTIKGQERSYGTFLKKQFWQKNLLRVSFLDGDSLLIQKIKDIVRDWEAACGVRFIYENSNADISVTFSNKGHWSYIGKDCKNRSPSMSLTGLSISMTDDDLRGVVLHEFGHAIGLVHEHQSPDFNIPWNEEKVYRYYKIKFGWSSEQTRDNVIYRYEFDQVNSNGFDPTSIMIYAIPRGLTTNSGFAVNWNYSLSNRDKDIVARYYR